MATCYWHHTSDPARLRICIDGSNPVCPDCCRTNCPVDTPGWNQKCRAQGWPVWGAQSPVPAVAAGPGCYWQHTSDPSRLRICIDGSNPVCPDCCRTNCPVDTPGWNQKCRAQGWPVWPPGSAGAVPVPLRAVSPPPAPIPVTPPVSVPARRWSVEILQNGAVVPPQNGVVKLKSRPFVVRVRMPKPATVRLNTLDNETNFRRIVPGLRTETEYPATAKGGSRAAEHCFWKGTGIIDAEFNRMLLVLGENQHQEIYYRSDGDHRWSDVAVTGNSAIFERKVFYIRLQSGGREVPVEEIRGWRLYLVFLVKQHGDGEIHEDELEKVLISVEG